MTDSSATPWSGTRRWHVADWGAWGWAETVVKLVAIAVAIAAAAHSGAWSVPESNELAYWIVVLVAALYVISIADRLMDREVVAMAFLVANLAGHWAMVYAMGDADWPRASLMAFAGLMLIGDLIKLGFFITTGARVRDLPRAVPIALTSFLILLYAVVLIAA